MRVAVLGTEGGVSFAAEGFDAALARAGDNTGNLMFQHAVWNTIQGPKLAVTPSMADVQRIKASADCLVIPAANQINPKFNLGPWADFVEALDLPCKVVGLGAQAPLGQDVTMPLNEGVLRFARAISTRSEIIGVRGIFTREVLSHNGVANTVVTGCPTQLINSELTGASIQREIESVKKRVQLNVAILGGTLEEGTRDVERQLYELALNYNNHIIVYQTNRSILKFIFEGEADDDSTKFLSWQRAILRPELELPEFLAYLRKHGRFFSTAQSWVDAMRRFDIAIGMRIHGAIAAIQAGRLGVCVAFDSRTLELSETMGVPHILSSDMREAQTLPEMMDCVRFDPNEFDAKRAHNVALIKKILP